MVVVVVVVIVVILVVVVVVVKAILAVMVIFDFQKLFFALCSYNSGDVGYEHRNAAHRDS